GFANWRTALDGERTNGERWVIGPSFTPSDLQEAPSFTHRVSLQNDLQGTALDVSLFERGTERCVRLPLPEASSAAPLLRGIFSRETSPEHHTSDARAVAMKRAPVISFDGSRVGVALRNESAALVFVVPRSAKDKPGAPRYLQWSTGYEPLAMSFMGK